MGLSAIREYLTPAINMITTLPKDIEQQVLTIHGDLEAHNVTTAANVQKLITQMMDTGKLGLFTTGTILAVSAVLFLKSYFSPFSFLLTPVTTIAALASATLFYDSHQIYQASKELYESFKNMRLNPNDDFILRPEAIRHWVNFTETLKYKTWIAEPLARTFLDHITQYLQEKTALIP